MKRRLSYALLAGLLLCGTALVGCGSDDEQNAEATDGAYQIGESLEDSTYAVVVDSEYGTDSLRTATFRQQMRRQMGMAMKQMGPGGMSPEQRQQVQRSIAEGFIMRHLLLGEAEERGIEVEPARVDSQITQIRNQFPNAQAFQQRLQQSGMSVDSLRSMIRQRLRLQTLQQRLAKETEAPSAAAIDSFRQARAQQVRAQHILFRLPPSASSAMEDSVRQVAQAVLDSAQSDIDFTALAERHSEGPSANKGGSVGYFSKGDMVPEFSEVAFALQDSGDVADELVHTQYGYHIIRLTGRRKVAPMDTAQARQQMMQTRQRETMERAQNRLRSQATIRVNPNVVTVDLNDEQESAAGGRQTSR